MPPPAEIGFRRFRIFISPGDIEASEVHATHAARHGRGRLVLRQLGHHGNADIRRQGPINFSNHRPQDPAQACVAVIHSDASAFFDARESQMKRREFIALLGGAAVAWPPRAHTQPNDRMRRIGVLMGLAGEDKEAQLQRAAFEDGLRQLGWIDGRNIAIAYRSATGDPGRSRELARELIELPCEIIVGHTPLNGVALVKETRTTPIVFVSLGDPVAQLGPDYVASFVRPGGNVTGFVNQEPSMAGKWLELLKEIDPSIGRAEIIFNPETAGGGGAYYLRPLEAAARSLSIKLVHAAAHNGDEIDRAVEAFVRDGGGGLIAMSDIFTSVHRDRIIALAAQYRLPAVYSFAFFVRSGGLISYGVSVSDLFRRSASYVDRILKSEKPGDLPVQAPTKFELAINLKTAKALGLTVPPTLLARADEVIE
jgi:putative tryptophan/tyrosine transport system substrate-binding protein